jgi:hypothetical protein
VPSIQVYAFKLPSRSFLPARKYSAPSPTQTCTSVLLSRYLPSGSQHVLAKPYTDLYIGIAVEIFAVWLMFMIVEVRRISTLWGLRLLGRSSHLMFMTAEVEFQLFLRAESVRVWVLLCVGRARKTSEQTPST